MGDCSKFSKVSFTVLFYREFTSELNFENFDLREPQPWEGKTVSAGRMGNCSKCYV